jgi:hypothetical protein
MTMSRTFAFVVCRLVLSCAPLAGAQTAHGQAYATVGTGRVGQTKNGMVVMAVGGQFIGRDGVGVAGELGRISRVRYTFDPPSVSRFITTLSTYLILPLAKPEPAFRLAPFAFVGFVYMPHALFDSPIAFVYGGGVNTRVTGHVGLRADLRAFYGMSSATTWGTTLGLVLR